MNIDQRIRLDELLSKFPNAEERYRNDALFHQCIDSLFYNGNPYSIIDQLITIINDNQERYKKAIGITPISIIK